mmetsp:Transcript_29525/g.54640  ORF Transcript_29525/g.54640 Transcript_29525/m.54640 type:complete len:245 (-) Transcript_29525:99-833(-)
MSHGVAIFLVLAAILVVGQTAYLKPLHNFQVRLPKASVSPNNSLRILKACSRRSRGGATLFDSKDDESIFNHLETLNEFASLQQEMYTPPSASTSKKSMIKLNQKKIGLALMTGGIFFTLLGMMLFFEGNLLRIGNLSFLLGTTMLVGPMRISQFFMQPKRYRATISLTLGILLVLIKWSKLGILLEIFGFFNLFGNMFPLLFRLLRSLPIVGDIFTALEGKTSSRRAASSATFEGEFFQRSGD